MRQTPAQPSPAARQLRVPLRRIERVYGREEYDVAADAVLGAFWVACEPLPDSSCAFVLDADHPNPWFHALVVTVAGASDAAFARFVRAVAGLGLLDPDH